MKANKARHVYTQRSQLLLRNCMYTHMYIISSLTKIFVTLYCVHRYIEEECVEIEVWSCPTRRRPETEAEGVFPASDDILLGTTAISLQPLCSESTVRSGLLYLRVICNLIQWCCVCVCVHSLV